MQEELSELRRAFISDLDAKFEASERRLRESLAKDVSTAIEASEARLQQGLTQEMARQLGTAEKHLAGQMQMHAEELKELVKKGAEGYGGALEGIQRNLADLNKKVDDKFSVYDKTLVNHAGRISTLERRRPRRRKVT